MKNKIHYSPESRRDLDDIWDYIVLELQNRSAAERVIDHIMNAVDPLKNFAEMGTPLSSIADVGTDYRFLVSGNYMVFYRVQGCDVYMNSYSNGSALNVSDLVWVLRNTPGLSETDKARAEKLLPANAPEKCYMPQ